LLEVGAGFGDGADAVGDETAEGLETSVFGKGDSDGAV